MVAPACDRIGQPSISRHSFRHTHATLFAEVGESIKTAQSLLGHSDLGTTLNNPRARNPPTRNVAPSNESREFCSQMFSNWRAARKPGKSTDCNVSTYRLVGGPARI
jgi:hypothetical protein